MRDRVQFLYLLQCICVSDRMDLPGCESQLEISRSQLYRSELTRLLDPEKIWRSSQEPHHLPVAASVHVATHWLTSRDRAMRRLLPPWLWCRRCHKPGSVWQRDAVDSVELSSGDGASILDGWILAWHRECFSKRPGCRYQWMTYP